MRLVLVAVIVSTVSTVGDRVEAQAAAKPTGFTIDGTWDLNVAKSEQPEPRMLRGGFGGRGGYPGGRGGGGWGRGGGGRGIPEPVVAEHPAEGGPGGGMMTAFRLVLVQSDSMLTITVPGNSFRRIRLDRPEVQDTLADGRITTVKTKLTDKKLVVERRSDRQKITETYELDKETGELILRTKVSGGRFSVDFKRVYVRSTRQ